MCPRVECIALEAYPASGGFVNEAPGGVPDGAGVQRTAAHRRIGLESRMFTFEGVIGYSAGDDEEASHFFEHTLGLELGAQDGSLRFYALADGVTLTVDVSGGMAGQPPYLLFSAANVVEAAEHFLQRGCQVRELSWAPGGAGFLARSPDGHTVAVIDAAALAGDNDGSPAG
jgi:hypothetical protein